jgi:hypothetical protein
LSSTLGGVPPKLFHFSSCPDPLWVQGSLCANPDCECGDVFFDLLEHDEARPYGVGDVKLALRVDTQTWQESQSPARPASLDALALDFLREYPAAERAVWQEEVAQKRQAARRIREYRLDPRVVETAELVAFGDILSERGSLYSGGTSVAFRFEHGGTRYLVDDLYCPNPDCHCEDVHLAFFRCRQSEADGATTVEECFRAIVSLEDGHVESVKCYQGTHGEASAVLRVWRDRPDFDYFLDDFRWRYGKVKEIAERNGPTRDAMRGPWGPSEEILSPPVERLSSPPRVGRNDPCPCGSGKKYKKCCGKASG